MSFTVAASAVSWGTGLVQSLASLHSPTACHRRQQSVLLSRGTPGGDHRHYKLQLHFGNDFETSQCVHTKGGLEGYGGVYSVLPVVSVCSIAKHTSDATLVGHQNAPPGLSWVALDLHTVESPVSTWNIDQTFSQVGLVDLCVGGVLCLYASSRKGSPQESVR